ncbi:MAG: signal transduction histidine kinase [Saprospiraceae bacterium]
MKWALSQQNNIRLKKEELHLAKLVLASVTPYTSNSRQKNIAIEIDIPENQMILADKNTLNIVIGNIVNNAIKFTKEGGLIHISNQSESEWVELHIRDTGIGMSEEQIYNLFRIEKSSTTYGTNNEKGSGLGLMFCKEFIEKNGSSVRVESEIGKGSVFIIKLPANPELTEAT